MSIPQTILVVETADELAFPGGVSEVRRVI